jgi:hypothetical protein
MLTTAIEAGLPLIIVSTTDTLHAAAVVKHLSGQGRVRVVEAPAGKRYAQTDPVEVRIGDLEHSAKSVIEFNVERGKTLVLVNPSERVSEAFDAGVLPVPDKLVQMKLQADFKMPPAFVPRIMAALGGLTLKEIDEVCRLAQAAAQELTPESVRQVRRYATQVVPGVRVVDTDFEHYYENPQLDEYLRNSAVFLLKDVDPRLRPRGLLCTGKPGTGKTLGSKWLARQLGVPLLRLDVGAVMSKYVGESEQNLMRALQVVVSSAPCVMLVDEVEKLFHGNDDSGVTQNLLAGLLWWLQEHRAQVLTFMTSNDPDKLPPELIRAGRVDASIEFVELPGGKQVEAYVEGLLQSLGLLTELAGLPKFLSAGQGRPHAQVTAQVIERVRRHLLTNGTE